jgi:hypothetical protein
LVSSVADLSDKIKVFPTVFNQSLTIETTEPCQFDLIDPLGRSILRGGFSGEKRLDTEGVGSGFYVLKISIGDKSMVRKVVKI